MCEMHLRDIEVNGSRSGAAANMSTRLPAHGIIFRETRPSTSRLHPARAGIHNQTSTPGEITRATARGLSGAATLILVEGHQRPRATCRTCGRQDRHSIFVRLSSSPSSTAWHDGEGIASSCALSNDNPRQSLRASEDLHGTYEMSLGYLEDRLAIKDRFVRTRGARPRRVETWSIASRRTCSLRQPSGRRHSGHAAYRAFAERFKRFHEAGAQTPPRDLETGGRGRRRSSPSDLYL